MSLNIFRNPVVDCVFFRVECLTHGGVRVADFETPTAGAKTLCPICQEESSWSPLGKGQTVRILPFYVPEATMEDQIQNRLKRSGGAVAEGQFVILVSEPDVMYHAEIVELWTNGKNVSSSGRPGIVFRIGTGKTDTIPHLSKTGGETPYWCTQEELALKVQAKAKAKAKKAGR